MQCDLVLLFALVVGCIACLDEGGAIDMLAGDGCLNCFGAGIDGDDQTFVVGFSQIDERIGSIDRTKHLPVAVIAQGRLAVPQAQQSLGKVEQRVHVAILCFDGETTAFGINGQIKPIICVVQGMPGIVRWKSMHTLSWSMVLRVP